MVKEFLQVSLTCPELGADLLEEMVAKEEGGKKNPLPSFHRSESFYEPDMKSI